MAGFSYKYRVAWVDTDNLGVVHFSNYFRICERAEEEFMNSIKLPFDSTNTISLPRVKAECNYKFPLRFNETANITITVKEIGKRHIKYEYQIYNDSQKKLSAVCEIVVVAIDRNFNPIEIPEELIKIYRDYFNL
ncbi:MAG: acyl-CoA thioesterase [Thermoplasmata archaeon]